MQTPRCGLTPACCAAVLLVKAVQHWRQGHGGQAPSGQDRAGFRKLLQSWQRTIDDVPIEVGASASLCVPRCSGCQLQSFGACLDTRTGTLSWALLQLGQLCEQRCLSGCPSPAAVWAFPTQAHPQKS